VTGKFDKTFKAGDTPDKKVKWLSEERAKNEALQETKFPSVKVVPYGK
jgi:hypothetical protein